MSNLKIAHKLYGGFALVVLLLVVAIGAALWQVSTIKEGTDRIVNLRTPTAQASQRMENGINASLAALRGWMLVDNTAFKTRRAHAWRAIAETRTTMDELSKNWTNPKNIETWTAFKVILDEFEVAQQKVEDIAHTPDETPATKILITEAAPRAAVMIKNISKMIDLELSGKGGTEGDRVQILGMMADVRGTLGIGLANIRAYLLTGQTKFVENFKKLWAKNERRFGDLGNSAHLLSPEQKAAYDEFAAKRKEFSPLPPRMFEVRGSKKWNMAQYILVTEAAPRAGALMAILAGEVQADGSRKGGMVANQKKLLQIDADAGAAQTGLLLTMEWILLFVGLAAGSVIAFFTARSISNPVVDMTGAMGALAQGNLETEIPAQDRGDEIGDMAQAVQVFKDRMIENTKMTDEVKKQNAEAARLLQMIDTMPVNVMLLNPSDFTITYVNQTSKTTLGPLQSLLPCPVDDLVGQCFDIFHKNPAYQRKILSDPKNLPHQAQIALGDETLNLKVNAVTDTSGHYMGAMLVWEVVTQKVQFAGQVKEVVEAVASSSTEMQTTAESMAATAEETNKQASAVATASEELTASVNEISQQVTRSATIANSAVEEAERSNAMVQGLAEAADKIGEVVNLITDIAEQTNLLALNATIEAARAGDAGKGFAVVAAEVKNLANQTAKATEDIAAQVTSIQGATQDAVSAIQGIGKTISEISEIATTISSAVEEQTAATQEVTGNITGVTTASGETGQAANQVLEVANELSKQGEQLTTQIDAFLGQGSA